MEKSSKVFIGMDVHKESIDLTLAEPGGEVRRLGQIGGDRASLLKMVRKQQSSGRELVFVYEAGPCGFWIYREIAALGLACMVVSPALIPKRAGDHVKTDRRDSERLASLARAGELEAIHVPDVRDEAVRDLVRARDDAVIAQRRVRQQLKALLLRNDIRYVGKTSWTGAHRRWLPELKLPEPAQLESPSRSTSMPSRWPPDASSGSPGRSRPRSAPGASPRWWRRYRRCAASSSCMP